MAGTPDRGWRIVGLALAWLGGVGWQLQQATLWPPGTALAWTLAAAAAAAWLLLRTQRRRHGTTLALGAVALAVLGFASTDWRASHRIADALPPALEGQDIMLTGVVAELPRLGSIGTRFVFDVESATHAGAAVGVPRRVSIGWYHGFDGEAIIASPPQALRAGDRWQLPVRLKQPHGNLNPHGFDLELWLFEQGIRASGHVRPGAVRLNSGEAHPVERWRQQIRDAVLVRVHDAGAAGVLAALAVGDQAAIERDEWGLYRHTGVAHLMSISGLHVTMFAWLAGLGVGRLWRRSARLMLAVPAPIAARWGGLLCAAAYALLAGWGVPAQRTVFMIGAVVLLRSLGLRWPTPLVLLVAALGVSVLDPWALLQPGFWLSFAAVGLLIASEPVTPPAVAAAQTLPARLRALVAHGLRTQTVATLGLAPLSMLFFQQVSVVGFLANLVAIPLVTLLITPLALLGVLLPPLWQVAGALVASLNAALGVLAAWPGAVWSAAAAPAWGVASGLLGGTLLLLPLPWRLRLLGLPLLLPLLAPAPVRPPEGSFELTAVDVGQGTAVLVRTARHLLVYDTGPQTSPEADAGERVLLPLLRARGEHVVDLLLLSHRDTDHVGGAASLLAGIPVRASSSSLADGHPLRARLPAHRRCDAGQRWAWDGVQFELLHPVAEDHARPLKPNALSCVLHVSAADGRRALLAGDIEADQEAALVARAGPALRADVLLVPHHGSKTSSTADFIDAVAPGWALVQAGYRSRFGHPAPEVLARYTARGVEVLRSDRCGAWTWAPGGGGSSCQRRVAPRYWHHPGIVTTVPSE
jgi:competence protein ComEC